MHFRYSSGEINSFGEFIVKGYKLHLKGILLLFSGMMLLKLISFVYAKAPQSIELSKVVERGFLIFSIIFFIFYLIIAYRRERYKAYTIKDDIIYEYFKDKEVDAIKITSLCYIKSKLVDGRVNYLIFFKKNKFLQMKSFGLITPSLASDLDKYFFSKGIEKWDYERIPK